MKRLFSWTLVASQLSLLAALGLSGRILPPFPWRCLLAAAVGLAAWAVFTMNPRRLRASPEPHPDGTLVTHGPYRFIRHPMYASLLLLAAGWIGGDPRAFRFILGAALALVLVVKMRYEESLLAEKYAGYAAYQKVSRQVIPWLW
jgi:protein-S-isoprenylcysteine O-methyltransferase Ste14